MILDFFISKGDFTKFHSSTFLRCHSPLPTPPSTKKPLFFISLSWHFVEFSRLLLSYTEIESVLLHLIIAVNIKTEDGKGGSISSSPLDVYQWQWLCLVYFDLLLIPTYRSLLCLLAVLTLLTEWKLYFPFLALQSSF